ncbi:MAG: glycoside hydrolase, partial [Actinobacteria bacterium]|nr:glycoside hydrolase [Actinomycetota bacterium]
MSGPVVEPLRERALDVLARNLRGAWTCPSSAIYPHQWLWDSCFVAIGLARTDPERAAGEVRSLLRGQWANGMFPHMIFATGVRDVGSRRLWQSSRYPDAPRGVNTSCITQPPIIAIAAQRVSDALAANARRDFLTELMPHIVAYHQWLYRERDLHGRGLVTLIHPWECGLDTTPAWTVPLASAWQPWWLRLVHRFRLARLARFLRRDTRYIPAAQRSSDDDGLRMLALARTGRRYGFDARRLPPERALIVEDLAFNAFLVVANRALEQLARDVGLEIDAALQRSMRATEAALEELWEERAGQYFSRNESTGELITIPTIATFLPLWAGVDPEHAVRLVEQLHQPQWATAWPVPSVPTDAAEFDPARYWQGPSWLNMNWAIVQALSRCGVPDLAHRLARRTLEMVEQGGFSEYFSPLTGQGFG